MRTKRNKRNKSPSAYSLEVAYKRAMLSREGITFDQAMQDPALKISLTRVAQAIDNPRKPDFKMLAAGVDK